MAFGDTGQLGRLGTDEAPEACAPVLALTDRVKIKTGPKQRTHRSRFFRRWPGGKSGAFALFGVYLDGPIHALQSRLVLLNRYPSGLSTPARMFGAFSSAWKRRPLRAIPLLPLPPGDVAADAHNVALLSGGGPKQCGHHEEYAHHVLPGNLVGRGQGAIQAIKT